MSNAGQAALTVVGTVVGAYFGYPQLGFVLGQLAGQALFPTQLPTVSGPKLTDRNTTTAQVGDPIVWIHGTDFSNCEVIWIDELETVTETTHQGKGGPSQDFETFKYYQSIALGVCDCEDGEVALSRIWENGKLMYDVRPQQTGETDSTFSARVTASAIYAETFVFYSGSDTQEPDPTIEAVRGVGNTQAFRGLAYLVYPRRQLQDTQAQRHPSFRVEVSNCTAAFSALKVFTAAGTWTKPFGLASADILCIGAGAGGGAGSIGLGAGSRSGGGGGGGGGASLESMTADDLPATVPVVVGIGGIGAPGYDDTHITSGPEASFYLNGECGRDGSDSEFVGYVVGPGGHGGAGGFYQGIPRPPEPGNISDGVGGAGTLAGGGAGGGLTGADGLPGKSTNDPQGSFDHGKPAGAGGGSGAGTNNGEPRIGGNGGSGEVNPDAVNPPIDNGAEGGTGGIAGVSPLGGHGAHGQASEIQHGGGGGGGGGFPGSSQYGVGGDGGNGALYGAGGGGGSSGNGNGFPDLTHPPEGHAGAGGRGANGIVIILQHFDGDPCAATRSVGEIVRKICARVTLTAIDTTTIDPIFIHGYALGRQMNARAAIDPLRSVAWFDVVESGRVLKFVRRGGPIVATLAPDDMGAHEYGGTPPPAITTKKAQNVDLPRVVRLHYFAISRDYEFGEALSPARISSAATNEYDVELPVTLESDLQGAEIAQTLWADLWAGAYMHEISVARPWIQLEGTDPISVPVDGEYQRMRIVSIIDSSMQLRKLTLTRDDDDSYIPTAVAADPERPPTTIALKAATLLVLLDLPPLRPEDDAGIYAAVAPLSDFAWAGAVVFRTCDGSNYTALTGAMPQSLIGELVSVPLLVPATTAIPDLASILIVEFAYGQPESVTFEALLAGANAAAIGRHGRWEVVQFQTATQVSTTRWHLTTLLRGRRGTEWVMGTGEIGDTFVLLNPDTLARLPVLNELIGESCEYRPVTVGTTFDAGADQEQTFEHEGRALVPFSPVDVHAELELDSDIFISWIRRDRIGSTLPPDGVFPMSEATEAYEVDVLFAGNVVRTIETSTPSATYTAAQQLADSVPPGGLLFRVYQLSAVVGRGTMGIGTLP